MGAGICTARLCSAELLALSPWWLLGCVPAALAAVQRSRAHCAPCSAAGGAQDPQRGWARQAGELRKQRMVSSALLLLPRLFKAILG